MLMTLLALVACKDGPLDDTAAQCGSTQGFVYGTVYDVDGSTPFADASVLAFDDAGSPPIEALVSSDGSYELNLTGGQPWTLTATYSEGDTDCYADDEVMEIEECTEYALDIVFEECQIADKPNLYLYPLVDTPTSVQLELAPRQQVVKSEPEYRGAWRGVAHPDGSFSVGSQRAPFLFYEVSLLPAQSRSLQRQVGWCVPAEGPDGGPEGGAVEAMAELLGEYGFNAAEREDFIEGWVHDLPPAEAYAVYPQLEVAHLTDLHIQPAMPVSRLWLLVADGVGCDLEAPPVLPFDRSGAHGVEWGVVLEGLGR